MRALAPVPACVAPLAARSHGAGTMRNLTEDQYWQLVFPAYDPETHTLPADALPCTGTRVFADDAFAGAAPAQGGIQVREGDIVYGSGGDRIRVLWMRTHHFPDGTEAGPLALVRTKEDFAEVYAVGAYHRKNGSVRLEVHRLGTELLVAATDDGCQGKPKTAACTTDVALFLPRLGRLAPVARVTTEKRAYAVGSEPGVEGDIEYALSASPEYAEDGIKIFEQVEAIDSSGHVVHKTELERKFVFHDGTLAQADGNDSLWGRVYPGAAAAR